MEKIDWRSTFQAVALLSLGACGVHEFRYLLAFGEHSQTALSQHGHSYLTVLAPALGLILATVFALTVLPARIPKDARTPSPVSLWLKATFALLSIYVVQELLEGMLAPGHPAGVEGLLSDDGWLALPLAGASGWFIAFAVKSVKTDPRVQLFDLKVDWDQAVTRGFRGSTSTACTRWLLAGHLGDRAPPRSPHF